MMQAFVLGSGFKNIFLIYGKPVPECLIKDFYIVQATGI